MEPFKLTTKIPRGLKATFQQLSDLDCYVMLTKPAGVSKKVLLPCRSKIIREMEGMNYKLRAIDDLGDVGGVEFLYFYAPTVSSMLHGSFPPPPVKGSDLLVPITTRVEMFIEALFTSVECGEFWVNRVDAGVAYFFIWLGEPRATVLVIWNKKILTHVECRKAGNLPVTGKEFKIVYAEVIKLFRNAGFKIEVADIDKARQLFKKAGFDLPAIPEKLAKQIKQREEMLFSTRAIPMSPNFSSFYVDEISNNEVGDYALISYSRNGANWMAIHYFLVFGPLRMFLELGRGGMYTDDEGGAIQAANIRDCFLLADKIVTATMAMCKANDRLTIFCSDFHGSYWVAPGQDAQETESRWQCPKDVLGEVLQWLKNKRKVEEMI